MWVTLSCVSLLVASNIFMTLAWYGHLKFMPNRVWYLAALVSWLIASVEYLLQVPANRLGHTLFSVAQLKIMQEVIALSVFIPIAIFVLGEKPKAGYFYASLCMIAALFFVFRYDQ